MATPEPDFVQFMRERAAVAQAYVSGDPAPLINVSTHEEPATFFGPAGGTESGVKHVLETNVAGSKQFQSGSESHLEVLQMKSSGDLGFWTGLQHASVQMQGKARPVKMSLRVTEVFRREEGAWKLVHRHADSLAEPTKKSTGHAP